MLSKEKKVQPTSKSGNDAKPIVSGLLPSVDEAGAAAVKILDNVNPALTAKEQAMFVAGFQECIKWLSSNDR